MQLSRRALMTTVFATGLAACAGTPVAGVRSGPAGPDATDIAAMIRRGDITAAEAVEAAIKRAEAAQPNIGFMVNDTYALARARVKEKLAGPFAGVPWLVKDLNGVTGAVTRMGSRATAGQPPATKMDAFITQTFAAGLVCIGKSAAPESGYLPTTEPLAFAPTRNPWNTGHSTGGSSGGAAAAVAAGVVPMSHANDGGGSNRFPAANCGLVGLKPSRGRLIHDRPGARPLDLAVQGVVSRTVRDTAGFLAAMEAQGSAAAHPVVGMVSAPGTRRLKVGVITMGLHGFEADAQVRRVMREQADRLADYGHSVSETKWPAPTSFSDDFLALWSLGAAQDMKTVQQLTGKPADLTVVEPFSLRMAENAAKLSPVDIDAVQKRLLGAATAYDEWIKGFDVVISPVFASPPAPLGYFRGDVPFDELRKRLLDQCGYTLIHNISGAPAISLPLGWSDSGLPIGVQVSAANGAERLLLEFAYEMEQKQPWIDKRPKVWVV